MIGITGNRGFVGSAIEQKVKNSVGLDIVDGYDVTDEQDIKHAFQPLKEGDTVIHCAAEADVGAPWNKAFQTNCVGTFQIGEYCSHNGLNLLNVSSITTRYPSASAYAHSKKMQEEIAERADCNSITVRLPNVVGAGHSKGNVHHMIQQAKDGGPVEAWYNGTGIRSYVSVQDVADTLIEVAMDGWDEHDKYEYVQSKVLSTKTVAGIVAEQFEGVEVEVVEKTASSPKDLTFLDNKDVNPVNAIVRQANNYGE